MKKCISIGIMGSVLAGGLCLSAIGVEPEARKIAEALSVVGVKEMEITTSNNCYYALVNVEFQNAGTQGVRLEDGDVEVWFAPKEGEKRTKAEVAPVADVERRVKDKDGKETVFVEQVRRIREIPTKEVLFGKALIGERQNGLEFKAAEPGKVSRFERLIALKIGEENSPETTASIASMANVVGDPKTKYVMRLIVNTKVALGLKDGWVKDDKKIQVELNLSPCMDQQYLFK